MRALAFAIVFVACASLSSARTWEVNADGSGDAPNVYAAMDSTVGGDIVLLGSGYYPLPDRLLIPGGVKLIGANGPAQTHLEALEKDVPTSGITLHGNMEGIHLFGVSNLLLSVYGGCTVRRCIVEGGVPETVTVYGGASFFYNAFPSGLFSIYSLSQFEGNIIGAHIVSSGLMDCCFISNDIYGPVDSNITIRADELNFFLDPQFCGIAGSGNYFLKSTSPCLPENNPYGVALMVGPLGVGCGAVSVETTTWGAIKALYMDRR